MIKKIVLFLSVFLVLITMNTHHHLHSNHNEEHQHIHENHHELHSFHSDVHNHEHIDFQIKIAIISAFFLLVVFLKINAFFFFIYLKNKVADLTSKTTYYYRYIIPPHPNFLRSILFHAPPR